jgi:hypothetical protein
MKIAEEMWMSVLMISNPDNRHACITGGGKLRDIKAA